MPPRHYPVKVMRIYVAPFNRVPVARDDSFLSTVYYCTNISAGYLQSYSTIRTLWFIFVLRKNDQYDGNNVSTDEC